MLVGIVLRSCFDGDTSPGSQGGAHKVKDGWQARLHRSSAT